MTAIKRQCQPISNWRSSASLRREVLSKMRVTAVSWD